MEVVEEAEVVVLLAGASSFAEMNGVGDSAVKAHLMGLSGAMIEEALEEEDEIGSVTVTVPTVGLNVNDPTVGQIVTASTEVTTVIVDTIGIDTTALIVTEIELTMANGRPNASEKAVGAVSPRRQMKPLKVSPTKTASSHLTRKSLNLTHFLITTKSLPEWA